MPKKQEESANRIIRHYGSKTDPETDTELTDDDDLFEHYTLVASKGQNPIRVDKFLANLLPFTTRSKIKNASQTGSISVNGKEVKVSQKVRGGDIVRLMLPYPPPPELEPEEMELDIRYEDDDLIIVHKPAGLVVHPSFGHWTGTLIHGLLWHFQHLPAPRGAKENHRPGLVHRIDKDTSGLMVIAKTDYAMAHLSKQFYDHTTGREYHAMVWGDLQEDRGTVIANIGRSQKDRKKFFAYPPDSDKGKHAVTHYEVLERFGVCTLVKCVLETGRTHQIRVHMRHLSHPLFSDHFYGGEKIVCGPPSRKYQQFIRNCFEIMPRQALHAKTLALTHPATGERLTFDSELPSDFQGLMDKLRHWRDHQTQP